MGNPNRYRPDEDLRDVRREANRFAIWGIGWWLAVVAVVAILFVGTWWLSVVLSGPKGQGDGFIQKNSAQNWLDAQARFEENNQEYEATLVRIDVFHQAHLADPTDPIAKTNWLGQISHCTDVAADYNADSRNYLREDFKHAGLPDRLDPATCVKTQENQK